MRKYLVGGNRDEGARPFSAAPLRQDKSKGSFGRWDTRDAVQSPSVGMLQSFSHPPWRPRGFLSGSHPLGSIPAPPWDLQGLQAPSRCPLQRGTPSSSSAPCSRSPLLPPRSSPASSGGRRPPPKVSSLFRASSALAAAAALPAGLSSRGAGCSSTLSFCCRPSYSCGSQRGSWLSSTEKPIPNSDSSVEGGDACPHLSSPSPAWAGGLLGREELQQPRGLEAGTVPQQPGRCPGTQWPPEPRA